MPMHASAPPRSLQQSRGQHALGLAVGTVLFALLTLPAAAMVPTTQSTSSAHRRAKAKPSPAAPVAPALPAPVIPPPPPPPDWPINDKAAPASVVWDSHGLRIDAANSSLQQILKDVSTDTGAKVEGLNADQRVFGSYGPGPANEVLSQLLNGTGYNVLMIGDQGAGTPRQIVLSSKPSGPAPAAGNNNRATMSEEDYEAEQELREQEQQQQQLQLQEQQQQQQRQQQQQQQQSQPPNMRNGFQPPETPGAPPRTPQQIIQQMQQMQQQQQQNQNNPQ